jgi:hypothetical protein
MLLPGSLNCLTYQIKHIMKLKPALYLAGLFTCICLVITACQKEYSLELNQGLGAQGTLAKDSLGNCSADSVVGTYYDGIEPGRDTAYVNVSVNVTTPGSYSIYTNTQNGFYFSDSGYFSTTGTQTVTLRPIGVPIIPGPTDFVVTFDSSTCNFTVNVQDSTGTGLGGGITNPNKSDSAWKFTGPLGSYNGPIDTAFTKDSAGVRYLYILGATQATSDTAWQIGVGFTGGAITTGSYSSQSSSLFWFTNGLTGSNIYTADYTITTVNTTVTINSYDTSTGIVTGTYSGTALDGTGNVVSITNGSFTAKVN